jgi:hypothetical protein
MDTRRDSDNSDASDPYFCVSCRRADPEAAGHGPGIDAPFAISGGLANTAPWPITRWLWRETSPRRSHGAVSWPGGPSSLSGRVRKIEASGGPALGPLQSILVELFSGLGGLPTLAGIPMAMVGPVPIFSVRVQDELSSIKRSSRIRLMLPGRIWVSPAMRRPCSQLAGLVAMVLGACGPLCSDFGCFREGANDLTQQHAMGSGKFRAYPARGHPVLGEILENIVVRIHNRRIGQRLSIG